MVTYITESSARADNAASLNERSRYLPFCDMMPDDFYTALGYPTIRNAVRHVFQSSSSYYQPEDIEDAVQDACLMVLRKAKTFRGDAMFTTWVHCVASSAAKNTLRYMARRRIYRASDISRMDGNAQLQRNPWPAKDSEIDSATLLHKMSEDDRIILLERYVAYRSVKEIADSGGSKRGVIKSRLFHARQRARVLAFRGRP